MAYSAALIQGNVIVNAIVLEDDADITWWEDALGGLLVPMDAHDIAWGIGWGWDPELNIPIEPPTPEPDPEPDPAP